MDSRSILRQTLCTCLLGLLPVLPMGSLVAQTTSPQAPPQTSPRVAATLPKASNDPFLPNSLAVAKVKLQSQETVYAEPGQALTVISTDNDSVVVQAADGKNHLRIARAALVPLKLSAPFYDQLIQASPQDASLYLGRATAHTAAEQIGKAIADLKQAVRLDVEYEAVYISLAELQMAQQDYEGVFQTMGTAIKINAANPTYHVLRGVGYRHLQKFPEAIDAFTQALKYKPDHIPALNSRGYIHYLMKNHRLALQDFDAWVKLEPNNPMAVNNRGYNRQFTGDYNGALKDYEQAIQLNPNFALAYQNKAWLLAACPDPQLRSGQEAFAAASKACVLRNYNNAEDLKALAAAYAELQDFKHAIEFQQRVVAAKQNSPSLAAEENILKTYQQNQPFRFTAPE